MDMKRHTVTRDGDLDLTFTGRKVGEGSHGHPGDYPHDWNRGTNVTLYLTESRRIVTAVRQWSKWQGERDSYRAAVHDTADAALSWLVEDAGGDLGPASKEAWLAAAETEPELFHRAVEVE